MKLIVGNWKMNGLTADGMERAKKLAVLMQATGHPAVEVVLCPPATLIQCVAESVKGSGIHCGGQDCHDQAAGAYTGDISAQMLKDLGCSYVVVGHSERRQFHKETSALVAAKAQAAHAAGLIAIICVGETDAERVAGRADAIVAEQLRDSIPAAATAHNTVVAYEPVWAIGTGKVASSEDIRQMHALIRSKTGAGMRLLYGGSVKSGNAGEIMGLPHVDGVLVGGASLKVEEFWAIAQAGGAV
jgi:triosephosphate isomerase